MDCVPQKSYVQQKIESIGLSKEEYNKIADTINSKLVYDAIDSEFKAIVAKLREDCLQYENKWGNSFKIKFEITQSVLNGFELIFNIVKASVQGNPQIPAHFFHP